MEAAGYARLSQLWWWTRTPARRCSRSDDSMREPRRWTAQVGAGLLVLLLVGCGGDKRRAESETNTVSQPSPAPASTGHPGEMPVIAATVTDPAHRAYVARVDGVCSRFDPERKEAQSRVREAADVGEAAKTYDDTVTLGQRELHEVEAIPVPKGEKALLNANVFDVIKRQLTIRRRISAALAAVELPRLRRLRGELDDLTRTLAAFARGYGFRVCGED